jgi:anhydro-N-acetylmuramic acid kinase
MSGTSADGVDAALVEWPDDGAFRPFRLLGFLEVPFEADLQERVHRLAAGALPGPEVLPELGRLDVLLAERFADAARAVAEQAGVAMDAVDAVASHGQTVGHYPEHRASLQIGDPSHLAERCGCEVVADFRPRDLAVGGEGAPLAPFFHWAALGDPAESRVALNLGGIANLTWLPAGGDPEAVVAFDIGPANSLVDGVVRAWTGGAERFDRDGARGRRGVVDESLLAELMDDDYLQRPPPKSTGRERYGTREAAALVDRWRAADRPLDDLVATLTAFTADAVAAACRDHLPGRDAKPATVERLLVGGGGARNPAMMEALERALAGTAVAPLDDAGVPLEAAEAMAFSLMGRNALLGLPNHLPRCTGARRPAVLGVRVPRP